MSDVVRYAHEMRDAMVRAGLDTKHAADAANNLAYPLAVETVVDAIVEMRRRLRHQRQHFGLVASDVEIEVFALAASLVRRPTDVE